VSGDYETTKGDMSSTEQQASGIKRTDLQQEDFSVPGREVVQNRVDIRGCFWCGIAVPRGTPALEKGRSVT
jgi:hypothetical protein